MKKDRIYIFVPRVLPGPRIMPPGRMGAQCAHAAAKLARHFEGVEYMTTLVLEIPSFEHLARVRDDLKQARISYISQRDTFETVYTVQAIITEPITKRKAQKFEKYELWK